MKKKDFNSMTSAEIQALSAEEFAAYLPEQKRSCAHCGWLKGYVNLWCTNDRAIAARGTQIPGTIKCPYWKPKSVKAWLDKPVKPWWNWWRK